MKQGQIKNDGDPHHHTKRTFILTLDLGRKISLLKMAGLEVPSPDNPLFTEIQEELIRMIKNCFPKDKVRVVTTRDLANEILEKAKVETANLSQSLIISTCNDIALR